jgi:hypothetical protein
MDEHELLAKRFEQNRSHLRAVAYRMLGSLSEAEDAVQEAWLRLNRSDPSEVENLGGWLTTVVAPFSRHVNNPLFNAITSVTVSGRSSWYEIHLRVLDLFRSRPNVLHWGTLCFPGRWGLHRTR